ncbi:domesticated amidase effector 2-like [Haemaphysalis longicornis]
MKAIVLSILLVIVPCIVHESDAFGCVNMTNHVGEWTFGEDKYECTALVKENCTDLKNYTTQAWRPGVRVEENCGIQPFTAIATFYNGRYPPPPRRDGHAAIFHTCSENGIWVYDQNINKRIGRTHFRFNDGSHPANNASNYYVITL